VSVLDGPVVTPKSWIATFLNTLLPQGKSQNHWEMLPELVSVHPVPSIAAHPL
jgi:hypothetical protein